MGVGVDVREDAGGGVHAGVGVHGYIYECGVAVSEGVGVNVSEGAGVGVGVSGRASAGVSVGMNTGVPAGMCARVWVRRVALRMRWGVAHSPPVTRCSYVDPTGPHQNGVTVAVVNAG